MYHENEDTKDTCIFDLEFMQPEQHETMKIYMVVFFLNHMKFFFSNEIHEKIFKIRIFQIA